LEQWSLVPVVSDGPCVTLVCVCVQDENRLKTVCMQATPINYKDYNQRLISDIEGLLGPTRQ